ncbi:MAG TPA: uroporphyrinogen decarboxylase family protein [Synergistaceae bacterium]|nr:uroporphyrinogen decarboxylase family protein [Synergistaceae bacterium]HQF91415.1 uroporphyrinogen decarboxylase family protein [Synergistaceae bacterium]HQH78464.1 uroporphyrinogen decarboxylase family protein [Synergistaceae bacterium]HQK23923.1 uroporphyrinogen decarboxylase family protein [Synergistaceae bacterium]
MGSVMTSMERVGAALSHRKPDRVPLVLLFGYAAAREAGVSVQEYMAREDLQVETQKAVRGRYALDCLSAFTYLGAEVEAMGSEIIFSPEAPPQVGKPIFSPPEALRAFEPPRPEDAPVLARTLRVLVALRRDSGDEAPIIGVVASPFSIPLMQLGFEGYLKLLAADRQGSQAAGELLDLLWKKNSHFAEIWGAAQLRAGAHALCYFDPLSSPSMVTREMWVRGGRPAAERFLAAFPGVPVICHLASGRGEGVIKDLADLGFVAVGVSAEEDLGELKAVADRRIALVGNLNGIAMRHWSAEETEAQVRLAVAKGAPGGGFILSDNHGEVPWQVPPEVIRGLGDALARHGTYSPD